METARQGPQVLARPIFADPVLSEERIRQRLKEILVPAEREARSRGKKLADDDRQSLIAHFLISEECIGPFSAPVIAGWFRRNLKIIPKVGPIQPFTLNPIQWAVLTELTLDLQAGRPVRYLVLKARQFGLSTLFQAILFFTAFRFAGWTATTVAHKDEASRNLMSMAIRYLRNMPARPAMNTENTKELVFKAPHESRLLIESAENKDAKRSFTNQALHLSEIAFWPYAEQTNLAIMQTVPDASWTMVFKESTANGVGGVFYNEYWAAKKKASDSTSNARAFFFPWHIHPDYSQNVSAEMQSKLLSTLDEEERAGVKVHGWTVEQLAWRRKTIADGCHGSVAKFHQEYPSTDREAFLVSGRPVFDLSLLEQRLDACRAEKIEFTGHLVYDG